MLLVRVIRLNGDEVVEVQQPSTRRQAKPVGRPSSCLQARGSQMRMACAIRYAGHLLKSLPLVKLHHDQPERCHRVNKVER